ncbi:MAG: DUF4392 domain-containing protein [Chloroflexi bacterium]|nr:DUF4392 domain-containing protein [Chloroflexota bacterium]
MSAIEDIILDRDRRGISTLRAHLPTDFCRDAATLILEHPEKALICSGFYILTVGAPETDGPPGAYFLGRALKRLGCTATHVTDRYSSFLYHGLPDIEEVVEFPVADGEASKQYAEELLERLRPSVVISTERCSVTATGRYLNRRGNDISEYNAKLDYLISGHPVTVGIGDGGNEIGMGSLRDQIAATAALPSEPAVTPVSRLVIASVSNWGVYGLIAALSQLASRNLLPSVAEEEEVIRGMVDRGAVDGMAAQQVYRVDGFSLKENGQTLSRLHTLLAQEGLPPTV